MSFKEKIGILGGTFDPIHIGHLKIAQYAAKAEGLDKIYLVPSGNPPHKKSKLVTDKIHRLNMVKIAAEGNDLLCVSDYEVQKDTPSYSTELIKHFKSITDSEIFFIIGADSLQDLPTWYDFDTLITLCNFLVFERPGKGNEEITHNINNLLKKNCRIKKVDMPHIDITSTDIRHRIKNGLSVSHMITDGCKKYIRENNLYGGIR